MVVTANSGTPIYVKDVGTVRIGYVPRLGKVGVWMGSGKPDVDDAVEGIVLLRPDETPDPVLIRLHKKVEELNNGILPKGVKLIPIIDRTDLVHTTSHTVEKNLIEGVLLVVAILFLFLGNVRAALIVAFTIPFALLFAFSCMNMIHIPANLLSLGAIDFGIIVNGAVIMVENIYRRLAARSPGETTMHAVLHATAEVQSEIVFTTAIIILAYLPLFTMQSVEKKMFSPMAYTIGFALIGSLIMAMLVAPVLCVIWLKGRLKDEETAVSKRMKSGYRKGLLWSLRNPLPTLTCGFGCCFYSESVLVMPKLGTEFLPHLDEGNLWIRATMPLTVSSSEAQKIAPSFPRSADIMERSTSRFGWLYLS